MNLSIIIPIYNVELWIGRCLDSCLNQGLPEAEYEIICVDDGSKDGSMDIVEQCAQKHSNIVMLHQANAGQSAARNHAMRVARGKYVWFVDSDDWVQPHCLPGMLDTLEKDQLDVLCFSFQFVDEDGTIRSDCYPQRKTGVVMTGESFISEIPMPAGPWAAIHRKAFLQENDIKYIEGIKREDEDFTVRAYCSAKRIEFVDVVAYNYFQRTGSTMKSVATSKAAYDLLAVADSLYDFASTKIDRNSVAFDAVMNHVSFAFSQALAYCYDGKPTISDFKCKPYYPLKINSQLSNGLKWKYRLINLSLRLYLIIYNIKKK